MIKYLRCFMLNCGKSGTWKSFFALITLGVFFSFTSAWAQSDNPLEKKIDLELMGKSLETAIGQITSRSKVDFLVGPDVAMPVEMKKKLVFLEARNITVKDAAEWLARSLGTRYRVSDQGETVELTSSYQWLDQVPSIARFYSLGALTPWNDAKSFLEILRELLKVYVVREPEYSLRLHPEDQKIIAFLPPALHARLSAIFGVMSGDVQIPQAKKTGFEHHNPSTGLKLKQPVIAEYKKFTLVEIISDLALQVDINIGLQFENYAAVSSQRFTFNQGETTLEKVLEVIIKKNKNLTVAITQPEAIWLSDTNKRQVIVGSRELLWKDIPIKAYDLRQLLALKDSKTIVSQARKSISKEAIGDPSIAIAYYQQKHCLIVIAPEQEQKRVEFFLAKGRQKGTN